MKKVIFVMFYVVLATYAISMNCSTVYAQESKQIKEIAKKETKQDTKKYAKSTIYVCPMGHEESSKPGNCSKCAMKLEPKKVNVTYACPKCDYHQARPGKCPDDGEKLQKVNVKFYCPKCDAELNPEELKTKPVK